MATRGGIIKANEGRRAISAMVLKFLAGPALMIVASYAIGLRGNLLKVAIVQVRKCYFYLLNI